MLNSHCKEKKKIGEGGHEVSCRRVRSEVLDKMVREGFAEKVTIFCKQISK